MIGSEEHFRRTIGPARAAIVLAALKTGTARARHLSVAEGFVELRTEPTVAFDLATKSLDGRLDVEPGVRKAVINGQILWVIDEIYAVRIKKLRPGYVPSNHSSGQQAAINAQLPLDGEGMEAIVYVTAGARYSASTGLVEEYVAVKHYPGITGSYVVEWVVNLEELAAGGLGPVAPALPIAPTSPVAPAAVVRRRELVADEDAER